MDSIRVAKVAGVLCNKPGSSTAGTLHLTAHHLIYKADGTPEEEMWVPYPLISLVTRLPQTLQGLTPLAFRCRTFETFTLSFVQDQDATDVFESVKELTVATSVTQLYAFNYVPNPSLPTQIGWSLYSPREEFARMGVGSRTKAWRFTDINKDYSFCPTYPARLVVPTKISDTTLAYACKYRSRSRIPALVYLHWANYGTITRASQPLVGLTNNRSVQDEKLIEAIFQSHHSPESPFSDAKVYGATATNLITDARPTTNAMATFAKGAGTENMDHYKDAKKVYLGVDNIHVMRDSLAKVIEALREADINAAALQSMDPSRPLPTESVFLDRQALRRSGWLRYISALLDGTLLVVRNIHVNSSHVLIHCSDGWDRTAQLSSLAQLCLDPFYRTIRGFEILIEKDWLSFGHRFLDRCGHLSSEKFFLTAGTNDNTGSADAAQAFLASVQNKFTPQHHLKETSPVFHQFLECVRQIQRQHPTRFEFNQRFLERLHYHLYACQFGTFLYNNEQARRAGDDSGRPASECTVSAWDWFNSPEELKKNINLEYDASLDDPKSRLPGANMGVLFPNPKDVRFWHELYGKTDEEMNGRILTEAAGVEISGSVDSAEDDPIISPARSPSTPPLTSSKPITQANGLGRTPSASASLPSLPTKLDRPPSVHTETFRPFGSVNSGYSLQTSNAESQQSEAGPSSLARQSRPGPALPKLPDAFTGGGLRSMWGKLSSNASAALSGVRDAYEGVAKDFASTSISSTSSNPNLTATGGELQSTDSAGTPWAELERPSSPMRSQPVGQLRSQPSTPIISLPLDPAVAHPTPLNYSSSSSASLASVSRTSLSTPSRRSDTLPILAPSTTPLPPSRNPSIVTVAPPSRNPSIVTVAQEPPLQSLSPQGQQSDPLGVGWL
ncbi:phosphatases II [Ramaria rubella]|nr:phosphatases II [Ramaria rubella]